MVDVYKDNRQVGYFNRSISDDHSDTDYVWHRDRRDRKVIPIKSNGWYIQFDNEMPIEMEEGKDVELNKPKVGGPKKYYVYVKDPSTGNIKKVSWGDTTGLKVKLNDPEARKSFAARHKCAQQKDRTSAAYWACNLPRYAKSLGLSGGGNFFW